MKIVYVIHGNHHEYPRDQATPVYACLPEHYYCQWFFLLIYSVGYLSQVYTNGFLLFFPGFFLGYLIYGTHALCHSCLEPPL